MCLILFSYKNHERYKLLVAANRDEFYERPTIPADFWKDEPSILSGIDRTAGGTWMGVNKKGKVAMLTNYRDLKNLKDSAPSRGHLVGEFLKNGDRGAEYLGDIPDNGEAYNGYNLIVGSAEELFYQSNYSEGVQEVRPGLHGLSNHLLDTPWPKVEQGNQKMAELFNEDRVEMTDVFNAMYDDQIHPDESLPDTGVGLEMERMLSSMFIKSPKYGSRCTTFISISHDNQLRFAERTYNVHDFSYLDRHYEFQIEG